MLHNALFLFFSFWNEYLWVSKSNAMKSFLLILLLAISMASFGQWTTDTVANTQICSYSNGAVSKVVPASNNHYYISYYGSMFGGYNMNLQLVDFEGNKLWAQNGITVSDNAQDSWIADYDMTVDHDNNAIVCFGDIRNGNPDIFINKIDQNSDQLWGENGIGLSNSASAEYSPRICVLNDNSVIATWAYDDVMRIQKVNADGTLAWGQEGINIIETGKSFGWPVPLPDDDGGFYIAYFKQTGSFPAMQRKIFVQRFFADGTPVWDEDVELCGYTGISSWDEIYARKDHNNGVLVYWKDDRDGDIIPDVAVQRVGADGIPSYIPNGVELSGDGYNCYYPAAVSLSDGSVIAFFTKTDGSQNYRGMYAQKIDFFGDVQWGNGMELFPLTLNFNYTIDVQMYNDEVFCLFSVFPEGMATDAKMFIYGLDSEGNDLWENPLPIAVDDYPKVHPFLSAPLEGQFVVSWESEDNGHVMAQNFTAWGGTGVIPVGGRNPLVNKGLFAVYNGIIHIMNPEISRLTIYDAQGRMIAEEKEPEGEIQVQHTGLFVIVAEDFKGQVQVEKLIK